ncbi:MAG: hypothetical protein LBS17_02830 [Actinomycetes bacterium]|nr:hypothetical protein [Actinomycetes bacterium]
MKQPVDITNRPLYFMRTEKVAPFLKFPHNAHPPWGVYEMGEKQMHIRKQLASIQNALPLKKNHRQ